VRGEIPVEGTRISKKIKMIKNICACLSLALIVLSMGGCAKQKAPQSNPAQQNPTQSTEISPEKSCQIDADCSCGRHKDTKQCFYGNIKYIDPASGSCPDFCGGIDGKLTSKCISGECKQVR
jgi:hypothetical protein